MQITKIRTGMASLDTMMDDGYPSGSFVLLLGEVGAGDIEFAYILCLRFAKCSPFDL